MKLRANIERSKEHGQTVAVTLRFPAGDKTYFPRMETIVERNIGPRPWSEARFTANDGRRVLIFGR